MFWADISTSGLKVSSLFDFIEKMTSEEAKGLVYDEGEHAHIILVE